MIKYFVSADVLNEVPSKQVEFIKYIADKHKINPDDINQVMDFEKVNGKMFLHYSIDDMKQKETFEIPEQASKDFIESIFFIQDSEDGIREIRYAQ